MAKKSEKKCKKSTVKKVLKEQQKLINRIVELQDFCIDNILSLEPLLQSDGDTFVVETRINQFEGLLSVLDVFEVVVCDDIPEDVIVENVT